ncbi:hypothetical protein [Aureimonas sp. AU40]|uniref:hypothetical protein n=1 Tax=Aureimonas sp. AU40 TaxID=1637747 RepID=UPI00078262D2|nr:hypothetical protein [Aureimonas sp. AU40]
MKAKLVTFSIALAVLGASFGLISAAGTPEPFQVRTVIMNGVSGPAYYSRSAGTFRFLAAQPSGQMAALDTQAR